MAQPTNGRTRLIRPGTPADLAAIERIQAASPEASHWKPADYLAYELWVVDNEAGDVAGFAVARSVAPGEWELLNLAVAPECRRQAAGINLLRWLLARHPGHWFLEVRGSNFAAQSLYRRAGFGEVGRRPEYYPNDSGGNREEGIVFGFPS